MNAQNEAPGKTSPIIAYFALAYLLSWSIEIPLALAGRGIIAPVLPMWTHYLVAYGPMLAAVIKPDRPHGDDRPGGPPVNPPG